MPRNHEPVSVEATIVAETKHAWLLDHGAAVDAWVPKSLVTRDEDAGTFVMPEWLALERGII